MLKENPFSEYSLKFCPNCGSKLNNNYKVFCPNCGNKLTNSLPNEISFISSEKEDDQSKFILFSLLFGQKKAEEVTKKNIIFGMIFCIGATIFLALESFLRGLAPNTPNNVIIYWFFSFFTGLFFVLSLRFIYYFLTAKE